MSTLWIIISSVAAFLALSFIIFLILIKPGKRRDGIEKYKKLKFAHRGLHNGEREENSLSAFKAAVDLGYAIELDVRLSSDGELVVFHDDTLDRVTKETGRVDERSAEELGNTEDTIPTFREVLELIDGRVPLLVEIKEDAGKYGVTEKTVEMLREYKGEYLIESFNPLALARVKKLMPEAIRGILSQNFLSDEKYRTPTHFLLQLLLLNCICRPDFIAFNHEHAKNLPLRIARKLFKAPTVAWTVKSKAAEERAYKNGFDGIIFEGYN